MHRRINRRASQIGPRLEGENPTSVSWPPDSEELSYPLSGRHSWMSPSGAAVVADGVQLQRIEITQTVQVVEQSVPPIAGKRSFVRVYFDWKGHRDRPQCGWDNRTAAGRWLGAYAGQSADAPLPSLIPRSTGIWSRSEWVSTAASCSNSQVRRQEVPWQRAASMVMAKGDPEAGLQHATRVPNADKRETSEFQDDREMGDWNSAGGRCDP